MRARRAAPLTFERLEDRTLLSGVTSSANDDWYGVLHDNVLYGSSVMDNDYDPEYNPLTASLASGTSHGSLSFQSDGTFTYTPDAGFVGYDSFVYTLSNGSNTANATATIDVYNSPPSAADDNYGVLHDTVLYGASVLQND